MISTFLALIFIAALYGGVLALAELMQTEVQGWADEAPPLLIRGALAKLPPEQQAEWAEEWAAELERRRRRPLSKLAFAVRVSLSAADLAVELGATERTEVRTSLHDDPDDSSSRLSLHEVAQRMYIDDHQQVWEILPNGRHAPVSKERLDALRAYLSYVLGPAADPHPAVGRRLGREHDQGP